MLLFFIIYLFFFLQQNHLVLDLEVLDLLLTHGSNNANVDLLTLIKGRTDLVTQVTLGHLQIVLGVSVVQQAGAVTLIRDINQTEIGTLDDGDLDVVGGRAQLLELLGGEDVDGDEVNLGVTVLSSLGGGHVNDLARVTLDHNVSALAEGGGLSGGGGISVGVGHCEERWRRTKRTAKRTG